MTSRVLRLTSAPGALGRALLDRAGSRGAAAQREAQARGLALMQRAQALGLERAAALASTWLGERLPPDAAMAPWQAQTLRAIQQTMCSYASAPGQAPLPDPDAIDALPTTLRFVEQLPEASRRQLGCALALLEAAPLALSKERVRFTRLSAQGRHEHLTRWADSPIEGMRAALHGVKSACMMGYWSQPQTWDAIGYDTDTDQPLNDLYDAQE